MSDDTTKRPRGRPRVENPKRHLVQVRCTQDEYMAIHQAATDAGMEVADFFRDRVVNGKPLRAIRRPRVDQEKLALALAEMKRVGPLANDLARAANGGAIPLEHELSQVAADTLKICGMLKDALGEEAGP